MKARGGRRWIGGLSLLIAVLLPGACDIFDDDDDGVFGTGQIKVNGSGVMGQESRAVSGYSGVSFRSEGTVRIERTGTESLLIRAEDNLMQYLVTESRGGMLDLRTAAGVQIDPTMPIEFEATAVTLEDVELIGVGDVHATGAAGSRVELMLSGVGDIHALDLTATELDNEMPGVGDVTVFGTATRQEVNLSGTGNYFGSGLESTDATVTISGQGNVTVRVSGTLNVTISGSGNVFYIGGPVVTSVITGSGRVEQM
jgi:hypothetical protein